MFTAYKNNRFLLIGYYKNELFIVNNWLIVYNQKNMLHLSTLSDLNFSIILENNDIINFELYCVKDISNFKKAINDIKQFKQLNLKPTNNYKLLSKINYTVNYDSQKLVNHNLSITFCYNKLKEKYFVSHPFIEISKMFI